MRIQLLYEPECSSMDIALGRLREVASEEGHDGPIEVVEVSTDERAVTHQFPGSPTIRIDGFDIDPLEGSTRYALTCRGYRLPDGRTTPYPPKELIRAALRGAIRSREEHSSIADERSAGGHDGD
ncbi:MAG: DF family (seleno)protein [Candidatus Limnocylindria bacterium]